MPACKCLFLDGREVEITVSSDATGEDLFKSVCNYLNIGDTRPFGIVHRGGTLPATYNWWVNPTKLLRKQVPGKCRIWAFALMVKYYPLGGGIESAEDIVRFNAVLQTRQDLLTGRLTCPDHTMALLASYWLQSEYGDFANESIDRQLVDAFRYIRKGAKQERRKLDADLDLEEQMIELHRFLRGTSPALADLKFLKLAASLEMYGVHFYPAYENMTAGQGKRRQDGSTAAFNDMLTGLMLGIGSNGIVVLKERKKSKTLMWGTIRAISFKNNAVVVKFNETAPSGKGGASAFVFDDLQQAKSVWRTAVDMHVRYRVEKRDAAEQRVNVKLERKYTLLGKKQATLKTRPATTPRPQLAAIRESASPATEPKAPKARGKNGRRPKKARAETRPKEVGTGSPLEERRKKEEEEEATRAKLPDSPVLSHTGSKSNAPRSIPSPDASPKIKRATLVPDQNPAPGEAPKPQPNTPVDGGTLPYDEKVASSVPQRLRSSRASTGPDVTSCSSSVVTDNTDVLCSSNIIEKAFSYAESDGINSINAWLELCTPRNERRGRPVSRSAPASHRSKSRGRSADEDEEDVLDIYDYRPLIPSKRPVVIRARELREIRDLSPPSKVHYEEEPARRMPGRYKSADNVSRRKWSPTRYESPSEQTSMERRYADIYRREFLRNFAEPAGAGTTDTYRRSRSMHSLRPTVKRERSASSENRRSLSPSSVSAIASSGSRRSCDSYLAAGLSYEDEDMYRRYSDMPFESTFARRVFSETRLNRQHLDAATRDAGYRPASMMRNRDPADRTKRSHVTSWALGDQYDVPKASSVKDGYSAARRSRDTIPSIPKFVKSVR